MKSILLSTLAVSACAGALVLAAPGCGGSKDPSGFDDGNGNGDGDGGGAGGEGGTLLGGGEAGTLGGGDGGTSTGPSCATATNTAARTPVYMLITLDASLSMSQNRDGSPSAKWTAVVPALDSIFDDLASDGDPAFAVGLTVFSDQMDTSKGCGSSGFPGYCDGPYPEKVDIPIGWVNMAQQTALRGRIDHTQPADGTPTQAALTGGYGELTGYTPATPVPTGGKKVHVVITDGVPSDLTYTAAKASALVATQLTDGTTTFVIGVGPFPTTSKGDYDPAFVGAMANAGGAAPAGCNPSEENDVTKVCHFQVTPGSKSASQLTQDFIAAINTIRGAVTSCTFTIDKSTGTIDPTKVNVIFTSGTGTMTTFLQDPTNGWTYDNPSDPTAVILHGTDCNTVKGDLKGKVSIQLGCKTQGVN